ncbi:MAG: outer membrane protein assembly factor, partial [Bacteroidales bacterium]|nr:outer membrane protein assembly factor [Bacteroidales bacterium]
YLDENPTIKRSFEEQLIIGSGYTITFSNQAINKNHNYFMVSQGLELAGNLANFLSSGIQGNRPSPENQHELFGVPYSQYVRLRNEMRYFLNIGRHDQVGIRTIAATAIPYGNSATIPYVKQFFVGGTNSVRAFRARTLGPGTYSPPDSLSNLYVDQSGDIKLEASLEYRFPIYGYLKGAIFVDAGNIWLVNEDEQRPGGKFDFKTFAKEFAFGSGLGLRIDFSFVVIRLDLAFPLRKPYLPDGERWVFDDIQLGNSSWRKNNMVFNLAIGYPF